METIFHNKILGVALIAWACAQAIKVFLGVIRERRFNFKWFIGTGGMPSSHASFASSLAMAIGLKEGFDSSIFAFATGFALVTMFDAQGVRRSTGQQAAILNQILDDMYFKGKIESNRLMELIGHTPLQVIVGCLLGCTVASALYQKWMY